LLDVGTGLGDIPRAAAAAARRFGIDLRLIGVERNHAAAASARRAGRGAPLALILGDGGALPLPPRSVDVVLASQVLHHLPPAVATQWIATLGTVARRAVVVADLRRSRLAMAGVWLASFPLGFGAVTRHDSVLSLQRGYTRAEMNALLVAAGVAPVARYRPWSRVVAAWEPR
jgi:SAM-dependent methyltransferase